MYSEQNIIWKKKKWSHPHTIDLHTIPGVYTGGKCPGVDVRGGGGG